MDLAQISATLDVVRDEDRRRADLRRVSAVIRREPTDLGYDLRNSATHIASLQTGPDEHVIRVRDTMEEHGVFASVFCAPAPTHNRTVLRLSLHCDLDDRDLDLIIGACRALLPSFRAHHPRALLTDP